MTKVINKDLNTLEEINNLLFYRNILPLEKIFSDSNELEDAINCFILIRHKLGEPHQVWLKAVFGSFLPLTIRVRQQPS